MNKETRPKEFGEEDKIERLLWCNRYCCLCEKPRGIDIEFAHLPGKENSDDIDDGIPVCSGCHIKINAYSVEHPKGTKYKAEELRRRREQVYEEHTRHLVPPIRYEITQDLPDGQKRSFPDVGFNITHLGNSLPVRLLVGTEIFLGDKCLKKPKEGTEHYSTEKPWNLNPRSGYRCPFRVPDQAVASNERLEIRIHVTITDQYGKPHRLLPVGWVYVRDKNSWYAEP